MQLTILGSGDAFSSGGRLSSCYALNSGDSNILLDCGPSVLVGLKQANLHGNAFSHIFISHLHGDHFAGLPFFLIDALFPAKRAEPLTIIGPPGLEARTRLACEVLYPRVMDNRRAFDLAYTEIWPETAHDVAGFRVTAYEVDHFSGAPSYALRFEKDGRTFAYSGDSGWTDNLIRAGHGADLYLMECYQFDMDLPMHLNYRTIAEKFDAIGARRIMLTHMAEPMLARRASVDPSRFILADDGMVIEI